MQFVKPAMEMMVSSSSQVDECMLFSEARPHATSLDDSQVSTQQRFFKALEKVLPSLPL
jgi:hypothetical protein